MDYQDEVESNIKIVEHNDTYVICAGRKAMQTLQEAVAMLADDPVTNGMLTVADERVIAAFKAVYVD